MKRAFFALFIGGVLAAFSGCCEQCCHCHPVRDFFGVGQGTARNAPETAADCKPCCRYCHGAGCQYCQPHTAGAASVDYPYYTLRGPRDWYASNPSSVGP